MDLAYITEHLRWIWRGFLVGLNNLYCIPTYVVWMFLLSPIRIISEELYWRIEAQFFYWLLTMVAFWSYSAGYDIIETGDNINPIINEECMVLVNHQSTSDVPILMAAFSTRNHLLHNLTWIMDGIFKFTNFGIVSILHGDFFIAAGRDKRDATLVLLKKYLKDIYATRNRKWIVLFPEGGFLRKRREAGHRYANRLKLPLLNHVTLPRLGAIQAIMDTIGPATVESALENVGADTSTELPLGKLKYVIDMTIAYPKGEPLDLGSVIFGYHKPCEVRMHYRVYPIEDVPSDHEQLQAWTYDRYIEKESLLDSYYKTGVFDPRLLVLNKRATDKLPNVAQENNAAGKSNNVTEFHSLPDIRHRNTGKRVVENSTHGSDNVDISSAERDALISSSSEGALLKRVLQQENQTEGESELVPIDSEHIMDLNLVDVGSQLNDFSSENLLAGKVAPFHNSTAVETGPTKFSKPAETGRRNHQDLVRIGIVHVFFILSTTLHVYGIYQVCCYLRDKMFT